MKWKEMLMPHLEEEFKDHEGYMHIAKVAEEEGCCHEASVLRDIAHEEKTHHKLLEELMYTGK